MKIYRSYLAICVAAALHTPQAFAEEPQAALESVTNTENIEPKGDLSTNPEEIIAEPYEDSQYENPETESNTINPVEDISNFYSDMDMRIRLAVKANEKPCSVDSCAENKAFDAKVQLIGESLAKSAYSIYPELKKTTPKFEFEVVDKKVLGTASNASGKIVLFRGIQHLDLDDDATAFIIGREMGHVIARHHNNNAKTKIFFTVLTGVLFPAATLISASSAAAQATTATTLMTSAASTVTSFVGSEVALSRIKPSQLSEADDVSIALLEYGGVTSAETAQSLEFIAENENSVGWEKDLYLSIHNVRKLAGEPIEVVAELDPLPDAYVAIEVNTPEPVKMQISKHPLIDITSAKAEIQPEQSSIEQKLVQTKPLEQPKAILITNETLLKNRNQANKDSKKEKNLVSVKGQTDKKAALRKAALVKEKTKKDSTRKAVTKNTRTKKSDKLAVKKTSGKTNKATVSSTKKVNKISVMKVTKKTGSDKK